MKQSDPSPTAKAALAYVAGFDEGHAFTAPAEGLLTNGLPAPDAIAILKEKLATTSPETRASIVDLLAPPRS